MAKLNLSATRRPDSAYSDFTAGYRLSSNVEDRRDTQKELRPSRTPRDVNTAVADILDPGTQTRTPRSRYGTADVNTPDDYSVGPADGGMVSKKTPGSGWPSVTSGDQTGVNRRASQARKMSPEDAIDITSNRR